MKIDKWLVVITEYEELIGITIAVTGSIIVPILIFLSRLWQRVGLLEQEMKQSIQVRKDLQHNILPIFQQVRMDIEVMKERLKEICDDIEVIKMEHRKGRFD